MGRRDILYVGETVLNGRYKVEKVIHSSGMANVYLVSDSNLNKQWCLKEIKKSKAGKDDVEFYSLLQEAQVMKSLNHAGIPRIVTIEEDGDSIFIVMDYIEGISLKSWIVRKGRIPQETVVVWMKQLCQIMMYLHNRSNPIFYRDMKPDNIMIQSDGNIKLLDFGISVVIKELNQKIDRALGTKGYAAPEQSKRGNVCDLRSDIYAMGKTMYYMLTGLNPTQLSKNNLKSIREIDSSISIGLDEIVKKCIKEDPDDRYQSCEELLQALQNYDKLDYTYKKKQKRKVRVVFGMLGLSVLIMAGSLVPYTMYKKQEKDLYQRYLTVAEQSGKLEDYEEVLEIDPVRLEPYKGYIDAIKIDGRFTKDEESRLLNYINPNLESIKLEDDYGEFAFNVGKLYWFYYEGNEDEGVVTSIKWFSDAEEEGYEPDIARVYSSLGEFKKVISTSVIESNDGGMYREYWNNLIKAREFDNGELINLQLNLYIANCISSYTYNLMQDGVTYDEVREQLNIIGSYIESYSPSESIKEKADKSFELLKNTYSVLGDKVKSVYKGGTK